ncbi:MAG: FKBP-type peptidyl-prolyl cis-trans isomerase [Saprospiraceae bacterium]|jgi:FKBP-type peptidyl-prolyl cis-trans isomerase FkpA
MKSYRLLFSLLLPLTLLAGSCTRQTQDEIDEEKIWKYLKENAPVGFVGHGSGVWYKILEPGSGGHPSVSSTITVNYKGTLLNKEVFDQTTGTPREFPLANLIEGWKIAVPFLQKGGKGTFILPSRLGYGPNPPPGIPANSVLVFEIELVNFR